jgi:hypothetical protein
MRQLILAILIATVILLVGCTEQTPAPEIILTPEEVSACLTELNSTAIHEITSQVADLDKKISEVEQKEAKLAEIQAQIDEDIAYLDELMADTTVRHNQYYEYIMPEEYLIYYQNDFYKLVKFERQYHSNQDFQDDVLWNIFQDIIIMDKASGVKDNIKVFEERLSVEKSTYTRQKTAKLEAEAKATQILGEMLQYADSWEISDEGNEIYSISGYGLGYTNHLTTGKWLYYMGPNTMEPKSPDSIRLKDIIAAKTNA